MSAVNNVDVDGFWGERLDDRSGCLLAWRRERLRESTYWSRKNFGGDLLANPRGCARYSPTGISSRSRSRSSARTDPVHRRQCFHGDGVQRGFHKDNADRVDPNAPDWNGRYTVLRFGIYLQDHYRHTGGLTCGTGRTTRLT